MLPSIRLCRGTRFVRTIICDLSALSIAPRLRGHPASGLRLRPRRSFNSPRGHLPRHSRTDLQITPTTKQVLWPFPAT